MGIRTVKPTSPARRYLTYVTPEEITRKEPEKSLLAPKRRTSGRKTYGRITVRHRGGGAKRMLRTVDFWLQPGRGAQMCRSAGAQAQLLAKEGERATLKLPSGEVRMVSVDCMAAIGQVGNLDHENVSVGKAGRVRWLGFRPTVRGTVMNPVDHPMGGGEGKGKVNHPMTPWGKPTKGYKTRRGARPSDRDIVTRRKK